MFVGAILSWLAIALFKVSVDLNKIIDVLPSVLYAGVFSSSIAYTLAIFGQKNTNTTIASLILSLESAFALLTGWIILGEKMNFIELIGCILMFSAVVIVQIPERGKDNIDKKA